MVRIANRGIHVSRIGLVSVCVFDSSVGGALISIRSVRSSLSSSLCCWKSWNQLCTPLHLEGTHPSTLHAKLIEQCQHRTNHETHQNLIKSKELHFQILEVRLPPISRSGQQFSLSLCSVVASAAWRLLKLCSGAPPEQARTKPSRGGEFGRCQLYFRNGRHTG